MMSIASFQSITTICYNLPIDLHSKIQIRTEKFEVRSFLKLTFQFENCKKPNKLYIILFKKLPKYDKTVDFNYLQILSFLWYEVGVL